MNRFVLRVSTVRSRIIDKSKDASNRLTFTDYPSLSYVQNDTRRIKRLARAPPNAPSGQITSAAAELTGIVLTDIHGQFVIKTETTVVTFGQYVQI